VQKPQGKCDINKNQGKPTSRCKLLASCSSNSNTAATATAAAAATSPPATLSDHRSNSSNNRSRNRCRALFFFKQAMGQSGAGFRSILQQLQHATLPSMLQQHCRGRHCCCSMPPAMRRSESLAWRYSGKMLKWQVPHKRDTQHNTTQHTHTHTHTCEQGKFAIRQQQSTKHKQQRQRNRLFSKQQRKLAQKVVEEKEETAGWLLLLSSHFQRDPT